MRNFIKILVLLMVPVMSLSFVACGISGSGGKVDDDPTKTHIKVLNYNGGFGTEWLEKAKARFEETYKDFSFETDKKGVVVDIDSEKDNYSGDGLYSTFMYNNNEIFFTEGVDYYGYINDNAKYLLDITDVLNDANNTYNSLDQNKDENGVSIASKLTTDQKSFLSSNGKTYAIPHYLGLNGIVYDMDLFNTKKLYIAENGGYTNYSGNKAKGPDGKEGTYDDGLPATYDEFVALCKYMKGSKGIDPLTISGKFSGTYGNNLLGSLFVDYEGENASLTYTLDGSATLMNVDTNTPDTKVITITKENGYETFRQAGKYYAFDFIERIKDYFDADSKDGDVNNVVAQTNYLRSVTKNTRIAFLIEGNWWENEASSVFESMAQNNSNMAKNVRKFGFLPFPKATADKIGSGTTLVDNNWAFGFIRSTIDSDKVLAAKTFLKFCYTDFSLEEFTVTTGQPKALKYSISDTSKLPTEFSRQIWALYSAEETKLIKIL